VSKIIVLVDDHAIVRQGLRSVLEREPQFAIVGEASSAAEALAVVAHQHPSIVLLDLKLSTSSDSEGLQQIQVAERVKSEQGMSAWPTCSQKTGQTAGSGEHRLFGLGFFGLGLLELGLRELSFRRLRCRWLGLRRQGRRRGGHPRTPADRCAGGRDAHRGDRRHPQRDRVEQRDDGAGARAAQRNALADPDALQPGQQLALR